MRFIAAHKVSAHPHADARCAHARTSSRMTRRRTGWSGRVAHSSTARRSQSVCTGAIAALMVARSSRLSAPAASACDHRLSVCSSSGSAPRAGLVGSGSKRRATARSRTNEGAAHCCPVPTASPPSIRPSLQVSLPIVVASSCLSPLSVRYRVLTGGVCAAGLAGCERIRSNREERQKGNKAERATPLHSTDAPNRFQFAHKLDTHIDGETPIS